MSNIKVLPNAYNPNYPPHQLVRILSRLPTKSLINLAQLWTALPQTQPSVDKAVGSDVSTAQLCQEISMELDAYKAAPKPPKKRTVVDKIIAEYWSAGLNLLQLASLDCQLLVDLGNAYYWSYSTVYNYKSYLKESQDRTSTQIIAFNPQRFLELLIANLSSFYYNHVYVCRHPEFPITIIRVQVFDLQARATRNATHNRKRAPNFASHKPFFIVIPINTPYVIHSPFGTASDLVCSIIVQSLETALSDSMKLSVKLVSADLRILPPVKSLESIFFTLGNSRFSSCLGMWIPYADDAVDINPLADLSFHQAKVASESVTRDEQRLQMANLRFKGTRSGVLQSEQLFDDKTKRKKRRTEDSTDVPTETETIMGKSQYASIAPVQNVEFKLTDPPSSEINAKLNIRLRLCGSDVFAGLHELSAMADGPVDPFRIPAWLTSEGGGRNGTVTGGVFRAYSARDVGGGLI
ncbi:hypothetical protein BABINDRAFT_36105 [Babjeviella inositovora NRRL Y-12698]|uniref:Uncharacterized protein n=1 Tax=Babjeviella inositovora NRRL Y-12698 TaxID=984486 RepID=A0A1E3QQG2_9ASCO|nr:uncharacterized protein BABINDRAFT_36105 [Babjeviella inositovora NRRL Y-12698]ODQ79900.1 hypothetical protein BABINDRAFT_36105 [Babjeviella inositovora NRRL Y-12698]